MSITVLVMGTEQKFAAADADEYTVKEAQVLKYVAPVSCAVISLL
jgi:hypothetical protein